MNPLEMEEVLVNLIRNAIESRARGARVLLSCARDENGVRIEVSDNGRGIEAKASKHIFDPFFTTRLQEGGTGVGLSVVHGIVTDHGGTIDVESQPGRGTRSRIVLPLAGQDEAGVGARS